MSYDLDDVIEHYGVKGMKWGVRKAGKSYMDASRKHEAKTKARRERQNVNLRNNKAAEKAHAKKVTKNAVRKVGKALGERNARKAKQQDAFHDKKMKSSKVYKSIYEATPKYHSVKGRDRIRQRSAKAQYRGLQLNVATMVIGGTMAAAGSKKGQKVIKSASNFVVSGQAQKIGKNVLNTVTGNPLRYVNAANMKNVVVDSGALGGR